ncbi:MAG: peptidase U34 [Chloroflexi bacterium]|nr:peptidase U34 [Chloroflexota bacterium]
MVALQNATADGSVIFAKNSDREPNEAHELLLVPAADHEEGSVVHCTYVQVPQVAHTYQVLLAKPFWIWGAEIGANEMGVVIGNEAVFTRVPYDKQPGLIGMDFIRLALERASSARAALDEIVRLLELYGQAGNCGFSHSFYYHNSFLIADLHEAWVLETAGRQWAAEKVKDVRSISNALTIGSEWDLASDGLVDYAVDRGWCKERSSFNFAQCYSDVLYTRLGDSRKRRFCTLNRLQQAKGQITVPTLMDLLRTHSPEKVNWRPDAALLGADVCMHAGFGPVRGSQSVGSMVSHLTAQRQTHWVTGTSAPCTGIFKPVWLDAGLPDLGPTPSGSYNEASLFWRHEVLHREVLRDYAARIGAYKADRDHLENGFVRQAAERMSAAAAERFALSQECFDSAEEVLQDWLGQVRAVPPHRAARAYYRLAWNALNRQAGIPINL